MKMARKKQGYSRSYSNRKVNEKSTRKRFLIVCEGKETERNYFEAFQNIGRDKKIATLKVIGFGAVGLSVVKEAKRLKENDNDYLDDEVWCVFDRDLKSENNNQQNFNEAIKLPMESNINLAVSNDAFELWYLLHYEYYQSQTHRSTLNEKLEDRLGKKYQKNSKTMYQILKDKQNDAIKNAKNLWLRHTQGRKNLTPQQAIKAHNINPSTTVYQLVEKLKSIMKIEEIR